MDHRPVRTDGWMLVRCMSWRHAHRPSPHWRLLWITPRRTADRRNLRQAVHPTRLMAEDTPGADSHQHDIVREPVGTSIEGPWNVAIGSLGLRRSPHGDVWRRLRLRGRWLRRAGWQRLCVPGQAAGRRLWGLVRARSPRRFRTGRGRRRPFGLPASTAAGSWGVWAVGRGSPHVIRHRAAGNRDESGDEPGFAPLPAAVRRTSCVADP